MQNEKEGFSRETLQRGKKKILQHQREQKRLYEGGNHPGRKNQTK